MIFLLHWGVYRASRGPPPATLTAVDVTTGEIALSTVKQLLGDHSCFVHASNVRHQGGPDGEDQVRTSQVVVMRYTCRRDQRAVILLDGGTIGHEGEYN